MPDFSRPGLHRHLALYAAGVAVMAAVNVLTSPGVWWVQWPALGWGVGLVSQALGALARGSLYTPDHDDARIASAAPTPQIALPGDADGAPPSQADALVARASALLRRERAGG